METLTMQKIKQTADRLFARSLDTGRVLEVRFWEPDTLIEIDLHLPLINMSEWTDVPYIKFKVDELTYRDYTPACWDAETHTCTLFVDAGHKGPGCNWARKLKKGDAVSYLKTGTSQQQPDALKSVVGLGDESSLGQLLALQQMTMPKTRFSGAIVLDRPEHHKQLDEYFKSPLQALSRKDNYGHHALMEWILAQQYQLGDSVFYISGNNVMVAQLRKMLKQQGFGSAHICVKGFWS